MLHSSRRLAFLAPLGLLLLAVPAQALYLFFMREDLDRLIRSDPESIVGKQVCFTDELIVIWPQVQERPDQVKDGNDRPSGPQYLLFDTGKFHCAIPQNNVDPHLQAIWDDAQKGYADISRQLEEINDQLRARQMTEVDAQNRRRELYWELYKVWSNKPIVTVYGTVQRADFWGKIWGGQDAGVDTEAITIVVDRVERPRRRWYEEGLDEQPFNDRVE